MGSVHRSLITAARRFRLRTTGLLVAVLAFVLPLTATPSAADHRPVRASPADHRPVRASPAGQVPVRGSAYMGMGVLTHDGWSGTPGRARATLTEGVDVASYQGSVAWSTLWGSGVKWAYSKATEGTSYRNPSFAQQYGGSYDIGMIRGAYHFATPDTASGATQADYFVDHGGGWSADGKTLPGALDMEWNPYGDACYGKSQSGLVSWIRDFLNRYRARTGRDAVIYTATSWWTTCTGNYGGFAATNPLWIARYASDAGTLPAGWSHYTMWQYTSTGRTVGDHDAFRGAPQDLRALAIG
ncbi:lysozyme [Streptomyces griseus]|uniref:lysozyme n=1 Tax=Streptomyces griseus TaxID=1911 RepID=UPI00055C5A97|nr:lysozyme [Streptomyces griseus]